MDIQSKGRSAHEKTIKHQKKSREWETKPHLPFTIGQEIYIPNDPARMFPSDQYFIVRNITPVDDGWEYELGGTGGGSATIAGRFDRNNTLLFWTYDVDQ